MPTDQQNRTACAYTFAVPQGFDDHDGPDTNGNNGGDALPDIDGNTNLYDVTPQMTPPPLPTTGTIEPEDDDDDKEEGQNGASSALKATKIEGERGQEAGVWGGAARGDAPPPLPQPPASSSSSPPPPPLGTTASPTSCETQENLRTVGVNRQTQDNGAVNGVGVLRTGWHVDRGGSLDGGGAREEGEELDSGKNGFERGTHEPVSPAGDSEWPWRDESQCKDSQTSDDSSGDNTKARNAAANTAAADADAADAYAAARAGRAASEGRRASESVESGLVSITPDDQNESRVDGVETNGKGEAGFDDAQDGGPLTADLGEGLLGAVAADAASAGEAAGTEAVEHGHLYSSRKESVDCQGDGMLQPEPRRSRDSAGFEAASAAEGDGHSCPSPIGADDGAEGIELAAGGTIRGSEDGNHAVLPVLSSENDDGVDRRDTTVALLAVSMLVARSHRYDRASGRWSKLRSHPPGQRQTTTAGGEAARAERVESLESAVELTRTAIGARDAQRASSAATPASVDARVAVENAARHAAFVRAASRQGRQSWSLDDDTDEGEAGAGVEGQERGRSGGEGGVGEDGTGGGNNGRFSDMLAAERSNASNHLESKRQATGFGADGATEGAEATVKEQEAAAGARLPQPRPSSLFVSPFVCCCERDLVDFSGFWCVLRKW